MFQPSDLYPFVQFSRARGKHRAGFLLNDHAFFVRRWMDKHSQAEWYGRRLIKRWSRLHAAKVRMLS